MLKAALSGFGPEGVRSGAVILPLRQATQLNSSACFVAISRPAKVSCFAMLVMSRCGMWQRRLCQTCNVVGEGVRSVTWRGEGFLGRGGGEEEAEAADPKSTGHNATRSTLEDCSASICEKAVKTVSASFSYPRAKASTSLISPLFSTCSSAVN